VRVTSSSGFILRKVFYTVPSRPIGYRLNLRIYDDRLDCFVGQSLVLTLPRGRPPSDGRRIQMVDYRHIIHSLRCKPMALLHLLYRDALFPRPAYSAAWERLLKTRPARVACRIMVELLALAHERSCEADLAAALVEQMEDDGVPESGAVARPLRPGRRPTARRRGEPALDRQLRRVGACDGSDSMRDNRSGRMSDSITVDAARLPLPLGELRLPTVTKLWQTRGAAISDDLLAHVAPLGWEHIGLTGDYVGPRPPMLRFGRYAMFGHVPALGGFACSFEQIGVVTPSTLLEIILGDVEPVVMRRIDTPLTLRLDCLESLSSSRH
jgi:hypothetical protein